MSDFSLEFLLSPFKNGIQLVKPEGKNNYHAHLAVEPSPLTSILQLSFCIHFSDQTNRLISLNKYTADACGFISERTAIGKNLLGVFNKASASLVNKHCDEVMATKQTKIYDEQVRRKDTIEQRCLSIKMPWYDDHEHLVGVFGCTIVEGIQPLAESLSIIASLGLLNVQHKTPCAPAIQLPKRQHDCLRLLVAGMTTKQIAFALSLSPRTIESYLIILKKKLNCH
ncbi:MAG: hypothetical protein HYX60_10965, partial [Legionella longbeachae]|nr:hypothetical protein [Legionella longbeachae]